jgi:hypothetical protein
VVVSDVQIYRLKKELGLTRPVTSGKRGPLSVWADPAVREECERLLREGLSYPQIGIRLVRRFKVDVTDSQIYRLKKELGLTKPAPMKTESADCTDCADREQPEPELPIAAEAEELEAKTAIAVDQGAEELSVVVAMKRAYEHGYRLNLALREFGEKFGDDPVTLEIHCQSEQTKPEGNGLDPVGNETDFVTSDPQHEQSADCADSADQIRPVSQQNPPVSSDRSRGDIPSFSEAILSLISRETIEGCQIAGNPRLSKVACLKRQVSSGKRYVSRNGNGHGPPRLNSQFQACEGCQHFLPDEDYETVQQHVKRGCEIRPSD